MVWILKCHHHTLIGQFVKVIGAIPANHRIHLIRPNHFAHTHHVPLRIPHSTFRINTSAPTSQVHLSLIHSAARLPFSLAMP